MRRAFSKETTRSNHVSVFGFIDLLYRFHGYDAVPIRQRAKAMDRFLMMLMMRGVVVVTFFSNMSELTAVRITRAVHRMFRSAWRMI